MGDDDAENPLAVEIRQEKAAVYFAVCKRMLTAIEALRTFGRELTRHSVHGQIVY
jgi:hypothetical protein